MLRFLHWDGFRKTVCLRVGGGVATTRAKLAEAIALNERLMGERRDIELQIREKNLFLRSLSHELRSPLNAIIGFSEILASGGLAPDSPKREEFAGHIHTKGLHLLRLINDVLELSRVEAGDYEFSPEAVNLNELIARVADLLQTRLVRKSLQLTVDAKADLAVVVADPVGLKHALLDHMLHAAELANEGSGITVRARLQAADRFRLEIHIAQPTDGRRMRAADSPVLEARLGRRLVEAQGGEVGKSVDSKLGITLYLVLDRLPKSHVASGQSATHPLAHRENQL